MLEGERRSISGIRGTESALPLGKVVDYTMAYATLLREIAQGNTVVLGRDTRATSAAYAEAAARALNEAGWDVVDLGVVPTPTAQIAIAKFEAAGAVVVTASHNPQEYNGVKFLQNRDGHGMFLYKEQVNELFDLYDKGAFDKRRLGRTHPVSAFEADFDDPPYTSEFLDRNRFDLPIYNKCILDYHLGRVMALLGRGMDRIRGMSFRVGIDCCGGAGIPLNFVLLDHLYCKVSRFNDVPGQFARPIEPTPANLAGLCGILKDQPEPLDAVFVTDCDNDRCVLVALNPATGDYAPLEEDYTFGIAVDHVLGQSPPGSTVVTNWSTSQMLYDIARSHHANLRRAPTGEVYTADEAAHYCAAVAGEGSCAGVIDPRVGMGRDVLVAITHVLGALAEKRRPLFGIAAGLPHYEKVNRDHPNSLTIERNHALLEIMQAQYAGKGNILFLNREDGLIVYFNDCSRVQVRSSNTEPILRVRAEAPDRDRANALIKEALALIKSAQSS